MFKMRMEKQEVLAILSRFFSSNQGTKGVLSCPQLHFRCYTLELPFNDNLPNESCIPEGVYTALWTKSPRFGYCYSLIGVPNRSNILIHAGNYAGAVGLKTHTYGCILPCKFFGSLDGQLAGLVSLPIVRKIEQVFKQQPFKLEVKNAYNSVRTTE